MGFWSSTFARSIIARSLDRSVARTLGRSIARSLGRSIARSLGRSVLGRSVARSFGRSVARSLVRWWLFVPLPKRGHPLWIHQDLASICIIMSVYVVARACLSRAHCARASHPPIARAATLCASLPLSVDQNSSSSCSSTCFAVTSCRHLASLTITARSACCPVDTCFFFGECTCSFYEVWS